MGWSIELWKGLAGSDKHKIALAIVFVLICVGVSVLIRGEAKIAIKAKKQPKLPPKAKVDVPLVIPMRATGPGMILHTDRFTIEQWGYGGGTKTIKATSDAVTIEKGEVRRRPQ